MRKYYLSQLTDVVMVDPESLAAQRLGGADFDGDMIKTIADNLLNECVKRNYEYDDLDDRSNLPLLYIPSEEPVTRNANDWHDRFVTVRDTEIPFPRASVKSAMLRLTGVLSLTMKTPTRKSVSAAVSKRRCCRF